MAIPNRTSFFLVLVVLASTGAAWMLFRHGRPRATRVQSSGGIEPVSGAAPAPLEESVPAGDVVSDPLAQDTTPKSAAREAEVESALEPLEVLVTDRDGRPIAGAVVQTFANSAASRFVADSGGRCRVLVPPEPVHPLSLMLPGPPLHLRVDAEGFFPMDAGIERKPQIRVQLARSATVRGRVLDSDSKAPVVNASVGLGQGRPEVTGPDGSYTIEVPVANTMWLLVKADGGPADTFYYQMDPASQIQERDLLLRRGTEIRGELVDLVTHAPVQDVAIFDEARNAELTRTGPTGAFRALILPSTSTNQFEIAVQAPGYCRLQKEWTPEELARSLPLRVELPRTSQIEGLVKDPEGNGIAGLTVLVAPGLRALVEGHGEDEHVPSRLGAKLNGWRLDDVSARPFAYARTDDSGRFLASDLVPWMPYYRVTAFPNQAASFEIRGGPLGGPGEVTRVEATAEVVAAGRVMGRLPLNGKPIEGELSWKGATRTGFGATGSDGRFSLDGVEAGDVTVETRRSTGRANGSMGLGSSHEITLKAGETLEKDFDLVVAMATISGRVTTARGEPAPRTRIFLLVPGRDPRFDASTETDGDGKWSIDVPADSIACTIRAGELPNLLEREGIRPGASGVEFVLKATASGRLRVRVIDATTGTVVPTPELYWREAGTPRLEQLGSGTVLTPDADGRYEADVPEGSIDLQVGARHLGYVTVLRRDVQIPAQGRGAQVEVKLGKGLGITLRLSAGQEIPPENRIWLVLLNPSELQEASRRVKEKASLSSSVAHEILGGWLFDEREAYVVAGEPYHVARLAPARYHLVVLESGVSIDPEDIDVREDGTTVDVCWQRHK